MAVWATNLVLEVYSAVVLAFWMEDTPMRVSTFTHSLVSLQLYQYQNSDSSLDGTVELALEVIMTLMIHSDLPYPLLH